MLFKTVISTLTVVGFPGGVNSHLNPIEPEPLNPIEIVTTTTIAPEGPCSSSPLTYNFELNFYQDCNTNDLEDKPGIGLALCDISENFQFIPRIPLFLTQAVSIQFLEFDTTNQRIVINRDDSYAIIDASIINAFESLKNGDIVTFKSIAHDLDPDVAINDQLEFLPGGVELTIQGLVIDLKSGRKTDVSNRITWNFTNDCGVEPVEVGDSIGWVTMVHSRELDEDGDGVQDDDDNCPLVANEVQTNSDSDSFGDACDNCPDDDNEGQTDRDGDGIGDVCDTCPDDPDDDADGDGFCGDVDVCPDSDLDLISIVLQEGPSLGCSLEDLIGGQCVCSGEWKNHGQYVQCSAHALNDQLSSGMISSDQKDLLQSHAAETHCGLKK